METLIQAESELPAGMILPGQLRPMASFSWLIRFLERHLNQIEFGQVPSETAEWSTGVWTHCWLATWTSREWYLYLDQSSSFSNRTSIANIDYLATAENWSCCVLRVGWLSWCLQSASKGFYLGYIVAHHWGKLSNLFGWLVTLVVQWMVPAIRNSRHFNAIVSSRPTLGLQCYSCKYWIHFIMRLYFDARCKPNWGPPLSVTL